MNERVVTMGKASLVNIMHELEPDRTKKSLKEDYDRVTRALNGLLNAYARELPKGTHLRIRLNDCLSINLCWMKGSARFAPYPNLWIRAAKRLGERLHAARAKAYHAWKASDPQTAAVASQQDSTQTEECADFRVG